MLELRITFGACGNYWKARDLVRMPPMGPDGFPEMVGVFDTSDNFALGMAANALSQAGIIYDIVAISDVSLNEAPVAPKWWTRPKNPSF
jgi:hypothetical protein